MSSPCNYTYVGRRVSLQEEAKDLTSIYFKVNRIHEEADDLPPPTKYSERGVLSVAE